MKYEDGILQTRLGNVDINNVILPSLIAAMVTVFSLERANVDPSRRPSLTTTLESQIEAPVRPRTRLEMTLAGVTAEEYARSVGRDLSDYELVGVHGRVKERNSIYRDPLCPETMQLPPGTEAVVNYEFDVSGKAFLDGSLTQCAGIALVPKQR